MAFIYGWVPPLVTQTGGMAAVAVTFATSARSRELCGTIARSPPSCCWLTAIIRFGAQGQ